MVVFKVTRVWKGDVGQEFEMPAIEETSACIGFWPSFLKVGEDLLVYASRFGGSEYKTAICGDQKLAKDADNDFKTLGPARNLRGHAKAKVKRPDVMRGILALRRDRQSWTKHGVPA